MIDTSTFEYEDSRWKDLFNHLKSKGFDVYSPGSKVGECIEPYVVIKNDGASKLPNFSTNNCLYAVLCYVPRDRYSDLEPYVASVKIAMKELEPLFKLYDSSDMASFYDDALKAHMINVEYKNYKKL